jgi:hypothetical protein
MCKPSANDCKILALEVVGLFIHAAYFGVISKSILENLYSMVCLAIHKLWKLTYIQNASPDSSLFSTAHQARDYGWLLANLQPPN